MPRTPARITQADVSRAIRAAKQAGGGKVRILTDGTIEIDPGPQSVPENPPIEEEDELVL